MAKKKPTVQVKKSVSKKAPSKNGSSLKTVSLLKIGQKAPSFSLQNEEGKSISLSSLKGSKVVLYFYPKDSTPGCTQESCDFRDSFSKLKKSGVVILGVSRDSIASHTKFKAKYNLPFSLLADEEGTLCEAFGVWKEKNLYGRKYMGIERSTFIINSKGKIAKIYPKVSVKGHVDQVLQDLAHLNEMESPA